VKVELPWPVEAIETDLIERPVRKIESMDKTLILSLEPYEIKTIRIVPRPSQQSPG